VNVVCDNVLIGGFAAQIKPISRALVEDVSRDFDLRVESADRPSETADGSQPQAAVPDVAAAGGNQRPPMFSAINRIKRFSFF
jgi:hypothetical protein